MHQSLEFISVAQQGISRCFHPPTTLYNWNHVIPLSRRFHLGGLSLNTSRSVLSRFHKHCKLWYELKGTRSHARVMIQNHNSEIYDNKGDTYQSNSNFQTFFQEFNLHNADIQSCFFQGHEYIQLWWGIFPKVSISNFLSRSFIWTIENNHLLKLHFCTSLIMNMQMNKI